MEGGARCQDKRDGVSLAAEEGRGSRFDWNGQKTQRKKNTENPRPRKPKIRNLFVYIGTVGIHWPTHTSASTDVFRARPISSANRCEPLKCAFMLFTF